MGYGKLGLVHIQMQDLRLKWAILIGRAKNKTSGSTFSSIHSSPDFNSTGVCLLTPHITARIFIGIIILF